MSNPAMTLPSYEALSKLASDDPQAFEALRAELVSCFIESAPKHHQRRLRGLQFRGDSIRSLSRSPLGALLKIQALMWNSFLDLDHELKAFGSVTESARSSSREPADTKPHPGECARVIAFRSR